MKRIGEGIGSADLLHHLAAKAGTVGDRVDVANPRPADQSEIDAVLASISSSYFRLRRGLAAITFVFPIVLWMFAGARWPLSSISAYYHFSATTADYGAGTMRNVFVGVLCAVGMFLYFYKGYSWKENLALNLAGVAAIFIAMCPMDWPPDSSFTWIGRIHGASAIIFFLAIAYVCTFRSNDTLELIDDRRKRRMFKRWYAAFGILMVALPLTVFAINEADGRQPHNLAIWFIEVAAIWVFAAFWLVKSREIALIEGR